MCNGQTGSGNGADDVNGACMLCRLKARAATLIQKYAGTNWQTAQRTKWMLDVVTHMDTDYR